MQSLPDRLTPIPVDISDLNHTDPRFKFFSDAIKAVPDADDSMSEEEKAGLLATKLKLTQDASLLSLSQLLTQVLYKPSIRPTNIHTRCLRGT